MVSSRPLNPILQALDSMEHVVQGMESKKWVFQGHPTQKKCPFFLPKNGLKRPILGKKQCFLGLGGQGNWEVSTRPPNPMMKVLDSKKHVLQHMEAKKWLLQGRPNQKRAIFCSKMA